jgi:spermidine/putrescine transport system permease protein
VDGLPQGDRAAVDARRRGRHDINSQLLGSPNTTMIGQVVAGQFLRVLDYPTAAALSVVLMLTILALVTWYVRRSGTEELL